jgi:mevalonate kinase
MNQGLLSSAGMSHPQIDRLQYETFQYGLATKITGAGGGGCVLTLLDSKEQLSNVKSLLLEQGMSTYETILGVRGVQGIMDDVDLLESSLETIKLRFG